MSNTKFELHKALSDPALVRTRDGRKVLEIGRYKTPGLKYSVYAIVEGLTGPTTERYTENGRYICNSNTMSDSDLIMQTKKITKYLTAYSDGPDSFRVGESYDTEREAEEGHVSNHFIGVFPFTVEV